MAARSVIEGSELVKDMKKGKAFILTGIIFLAVGALFNIRNIIRLVSLLTAPEPESIGIIGGADGPTAIFISERLFMDISISEKAGLALIIAAPILIIIGIVSLCRGRHPRRPK